MAIYSVASRIVGGPKVKQRSPAQRCHPRPGAKAKSMRRGEEAGGESVHIANADDGTPRTVITGTCAPPCIQPTACWFV